MESPTIIRRALRGKGPILLTSPVNSVSVNQLKDTIHAATAGVNYHF